MKACFYSVKPEWLTYGNVCFKQSEGWFKIVYHTHTLARTYIYTHNEHTPSHIHIHTHTHTHAQTHADTHTHTHTHVNVIFTHLVCVSQLFNQVNHWVLHTQKDGLFSDVFSFVCPLHRYLFEVNATHCLVYICWLSLFVGFTPKMRQNWLTHLALQQDVFGRFLFACVDI